MLEVTTSREPEWDEQSRGWVLALHLYRSLLHDGCGGYLPHVTNPERDGAYAAGDPVRCHACTARQARAKAHTDGPHEPHPEALLWPVTLRRPGR